MADSEVGTVVFTVAFEIVIGDNTDSLGNALCQAVEEKVVGPSISGAVLLTGIRSGHPDSVVPTLPVLTVQGPQSGPEPPQVRTRWDL